MAETTHIICAHCGEDNKISNSVTSDGTLTVTDFWEDIVVLLFKCKICNVEYKLPMRWRNKNA